MCVYMCVCGERVQYLYFFLRISLFWSDASPAVFFTMMRDLVAEVLELWMKQNTSSTKTESRSRRPVQFRPDHINAISRSRFRIAMLWVRNGHTNANSHCFCRAQRCRIALVSPGLHTYAKGLANGHLRLFFIVATRIPEHKLSWALKRPTSALQSGPGSQPPPSFSPSNPPPPCLVVCSSTSGPRNKRNSPVFSGEQWKRCHGWRCGIRSETKLGQNKSSTFVNEQGQVEFTEFTVNSRMFCILEIHPEQ